MAAFRKILITGAAGFVGRHMIDASLARGFKVRGLDNFMCSSKKDFIRDYGKKIDFVEGDIRDFKDAEKAVKGMDAIYHFAAIRSVVKTVEDPFVAHEVNATGALYLLEACLRAKVKHYVFTSTSAVYGAAIAAKQREDGALLPMSPYGVAKLAAENYAKYYFHEKGLPTTCMRIFNVYGPRQNPESRYSLAIPGLLAKIYAGERPVIDGSGEQARDFVYIGDVIDAFFRVLGKPRTYGKSYNLGAGRAYSINTLTDNLLHLTDSKLKPVHGPRRPGDPDRTCADVSLIRKDAGWRPRVSLKEGLKRTVESWQK